MCKTSAKVSSKAGRVRRDPSRIRRHATARSAELTGEVAAERSAGSVRFCYLFSRNDDDDDEDGGRDDHDEDDDHEGASALVSSSA